MAIYRGGKSRDDIFIGGTKADQFEFDPLDLNSGDTIVGGSGRAIDVLRFTAAGAIGVSAMANVSGIERLELANGANSVVLSDAFVASANGGRVQVVGGSGDDLVYAAGLIEGQAIDFVSNGGTDYVFSGRGDDSFTFDVATFGADDQIDGGAGYNTLVLTGAGTVNATQLHGFGGIAAVTLGDGGIILTLTDGLVTEASGLVVTGGAGADMIDASLITLTTLSLLGGAGDDIIRAGNSGGMVDGGAGADTITIGRGGIVYDSDDIRVSTGEGTLYVKGAATIDLGRFRDQSLGDRAVVTGFQNVDASASAEGVTITGLQFGSLVGGAGRDTITNGNYLRGGAGADTLTGSRSVPNVTFELLEGDFASGEVIRSGGTSVYDTLQITGSVDLRIGTIEGIDRLSITAAGRQTEIMMSAAQFASIEYVSGEADADHAITVHVEFGRDDTAPTRVSSYGATLDLQFSDKDDTIGQYGGSVVIHGGGGNDAITSNGSSFGEDGDDAISSGLRAGVRDGGAGSDTLVLSDYALDPVVIDLSAREQGISGVGPIAGFENIDASRVEGRGVTITGSAAANTITGSFFEADILSGGGGNDILRGGDAYSGGRDALDGGKGDDLLFGSSGFEGTDLTGGAGEDTFRWSTRANDFGIDPIDRVTDFKPGSDHLEFLEAEFEFSGSAFDMLVVANGARTDITGADLILYKGVINSIFDVVDYINAAAGGNDDGVFVAGLNSAGEAVLYHSLAAGSADEFTITQIANLGDIGKLTNLTLSDFAFI